MTDNPKTLTIDLNFYAIETNIKIDSLLIMKAVITCESGIQN